MKFKILFVFIIVLAFSLRSFEIGNIPGTLYGDELAFAWNAYNILLTGQDEYGTVFPLQFRSFDDYKSPVPVYLLVPFIHFFGLNPFSIRLPIVIVSVLTVISTFFLFRFFFSRKISSIGIFLFAISPWHIHLSRGYFEVIISQLFFILGINYFIKSGINLKFIFISMTFFALSLYSYFTPRIFVPILLLFLFLWKIFTLRGNPVRGIFFRRHILGIGFLIILLLPLIKLTIFDSGFSRYQNLSKSADAVIADIVRRERYASNLPEFWRSFFHNKIVVKIRNIKNNYMEQLSPNYWFIYGDNSLRYFTGNMGMFYLYELLFFILGVYFLLQKKKHIAILFIGWILLGVVPAALVGKPFAVRSLLILPAPFVFTAFGLYKITNFITRIKWRFLFLSIVSISVVIALGSLLIRYYFEYPVYAATWWGWENDAAYKLAKENEAKYDHIFLSDFYTGMPLAFAVFEKVDPFAYRKALANPVYLADNRKFINIGKYYIGSLDVDKRRLDDAIIPANSLYIGRPEEADSNETIKAPDDGRILFKIHRTE